MIVSGFICDGPRCKNGPNESRMQVMWDVDEIKDHPENMPDVFYRFIIRQRTYETPHQGMSAQPKGRQFCSTDCERDYIRNEVPPLSPREQAMIDRNNKDVEEKRAAKIVEVATSNVEPVKHDTTTDMVNV